MTPSLERPVLVLGGTGQIGFEVMRALSGTPVVAPPRAELDLSDLRAVASYLRGVRPRLIVNAAAYTSVDRAEQDIAACRRLNAELPGVVGEEAKHIGAAVIHYSTDYVFDGTSPVPYDEDAEPAPLSVYGATKLAGERALLAANPASIVLRTSWVYGVRGRNFALAMRDKLARQEHIRVVDDQRGAPTWSALIAAHTVQIARHLGEQLAPWRERSGLYHLTAGGETTWFGFACALASNRAPRGTGEMIEPVSSADYATTARRPRNSLLSNSRIASEFGIRMTGWEAQLALAFPP